MVVTGQELQGPRACRAVSQAADGRSQGGLRHYPAAQHPRGACIGIPHRHPASTSLALPSDVLNPHNHRRGQPIVTASLTTPATPKK